MKTSIQVEIKSEREMAMKMNRVWLGITTGMLFLSGCHMPLPAPPQKPLPSTPANDDEDIE